MSMSPTETLCECPSAIEEPLRLFALTRFSSTSLPPVTMCPVPWSTTNSSASFSCRAAGAVLGRYSSWARYGAISSIGSATSGASPLRSAFAFLTRSMICLWLMNCVDAGAADWERAGAAKASKATARMGLRMGSSGRRAPIVLIAAQDCNPAPGARLLGRPLLRAGAGQRPNAAFIGGELARISRIDDATIAQHVGAIRDLEGHARILFDQQDGNSLVAHFRYDAKHLPDDQRRQTLRRFVE